MLYKVMKWMSLLMIALTVIGRLISIIGQPIDIFSDWALIAVAVILWAATFKEVR